MAVTVADINKLRKMTQAGMMDCKKALTEANGDFDEAIAILRKSGAAKAAKRADRNAGEGLAFAKAEKGGRVGVLISLNCETDFVAKNEDFNKLATTILEIALDQKPMSADALKGLSFDGNGLTVGEKLVEATGAIGEKIEIGAYHLVQAESVVGYIHPGNQVASIVGFNKEGHAVLGKNIAMQVAAMSPVAIDEHSVPADIRDRELSIGREKALQEGKPEHIVDKIAEGNLKKFYQDNTLLHQAFIIDNKKSVGQYLKENDSELKITDFKRVQLN